MFLIIVLPGTYFEILFNSNPHYPSLPYSFGVTFHTAKCTKPCMNGGKCSNPFINTCNCTQGWAGAQCERRKLFSHLLHSAKHALFYQLACNHTTVSRDGIILVSLNIGVPIEVKTVSTFLLSSFVLLIQ